MHPRVSLAYFITPHGFGHAARASAVMEAVYERWPFVRFEIFGNTPEWFFADGLTVPHGCHAAETDIGMVQQSSLEVDQKKTIEALDAFLPFDDGQIEAFAGRLRALDCRAVICDIAPLGIAAGKRAGLPTVLVENFTWDWIYRGDPAAANGADELADYICARVARADELLEVVSEEGETVGAAPRCRIHGNNDWLHCVVHVLICDAQNRLLLQKRSMNKSVAAGKWDTSVGGHVDCGESVEAALYRETAEELGIRPESVQLAYQYIHTNAHESELVYTYVCQYDGEFCYNPEEIDAVRFWTTGEIEAQMGRQVLSDNFEDEFQRYRRWCGRI
ncbi:MAG: NUDIX hydrolase [Thermodesulfobacteriota bacterium]